MRRGVLLFGALIVVLLAADAWATYTFLTEPHPGANDFYSRYGGARAFWVDHLNPYGDAASLQIQQGIYGRAALPGEDPGYFAYPFYTAILVAPFALLPYSLAEALWLTLLDACLIGAFFALADWYGWRPPRWLLALGIVWSFAFYPASRGLFLGQPGILVYFCEALTLWALAKGRDELAGAALAISTIKPQMGFLLVPFLLLWALRTRHWRFVAAFGVAWGGLMLVSFALLPSWFGDWLAQLRLYPEYTAIGSPVWVLTHVYLPFLGTPGEIGLTALLALGLLWAWWQTLRTEQGGRWFAWTAALTLIVTHLVALRTATPHFVVFSVVLVYLFRELTRADRRRGSWVVALAMVVSAVGLWGLFLATVTNRFEHPALYLPLPFGSLALLLLSRRLWLNAPPAAPPGSAR